MAESERVVRLRRDSSGPDSDRGASPGASSAAVFGLIDQALAANAAGDKERVEAVLKQIRLALASAEAARLRSDAAR